MSNYSLAVIIPNYNKEKYLKNCIDSVLKQTLQPDEIIIVDDASTDDSAILLKKIESENINVKVILLECNGGVSNARNTGLKNARSEYVTFLDSDDYYYNKHKLENEMMLIRKYAEKGEDIVAYSAFVRVSDNKEIISVPNVKKERFLNGQIFYSLLAERGAGKEPRDYCVRKDLLLGIGAYSYPINYFEDLDLIIRLSKKAKFIFSKDYGTAYRDTPAGLSKKSADRFNKAIKEIRYSYIKKLSNKGKILYRFEKFRKLLEYILYVITVKLQKNRKGI